MVHLLKETIFNQTVLVERKGGLLLSAAEMGFFTKIICYWTKVDLQICYFKKKKILVWLKRKAKTKYLGFRVCWEFSPHSGKPAILVGVSQMEHNVWKPFKWLFDNLIKENASSHRTPPTVDKWCHLLWKYFTKHFHLESVSNSGFKIKHV